MASPPIDNKLELVDEFIQLFKPDVDGNITDLNAGNHIDIEKIKDIQVLVSNNEIPNMTVDGGDITKENLLKAINTVIKKKSPSLGGRRKTRRHRKNKVSRKSKKASRSRKSRSRK